MKKSFLMSWGLIVGLFLASSLSVEAKAELSTVQYDDGIPVEIREMCERIGEEYEICPELLESMAYQESRFIPTVRNKNHYGMMQVNVVIHKDRIEKYGFTQEDMFDPEKNLIVAADLLKELYDTYGDDNPIVLSYYSGNAKAIERYKTQGLVTPYVSEVLNRSAQYERAHGK